MGWKFPEIPHLRPVVHLHYLEHFGASYHPKLSIIMFHEVSNFQEFPDLVIVK